MKSIVCYILIALLLLCLLDMPYDYYTIVRVSAMIGFGYLACDYIINENSVGYLFIVLAILFQPFLKITFSKVTWNVLDVIVAIILSILIYIDKQNTQKHEHL